MQLLVSLKLKPRQTELLLGSVIHLYSIILSLGNENHLCTYKLEPITTSASLHAEVIHPLRLHTKWGCAY